VAVSLNHLSTRPHGYDYRMTRVHRLAVVVCAAASALSADAAAAARPGPPDPLSIVRLAQRHGVRCSSFIRVSPSRSVAREGRCREFAFATFAVDRGATWYRERRDEPWFPADWVVLGDRFAAWTSREAVARSLAAAVAGSVGPGKAPGSGGANRSGLRRGSSL